VRPPSDVRDLAELPLVLTVEESAALCRVGRSAMYEAVRRGEIRTVSLGRRLLVPRAALAELLGEPLSPDLVSGDGPLTSDDSAPTDGQPPGGGVERSRVGA
jgi:excisionase family DNA binding protein